MRSGVAAIDDLYSSTNTEGGMQTAVAFSTTIAQSRVDSVPLNNVSDRGPADPMAEVAEWSLDACVAPARILVSYSDNQIGDDLHHPTPTGGVSLMSPLLGDQLPVPPKDGVGSDKRSDFGEGAAADGFAPHGEAFALIVSQ